MLIGGSCSIGVGDDGLRDVNWLNVGPFRTYECVTQRVQCVRGCKTDDQASAFRLLGNKKPNNDVTADRRLDQSPRLGDCLLHASWRSSDAEALMLLSWLTFSQPECSYVPLNLSHSATSLPYRSKLGLRCWEAASIFLRGGLKKTRDAPVLIPVWRITTNTGV